MQTSLVAALGLPSGVPGWVWLAGSATTLLAIIGVIGAVRMGKTNR